MVQGSRMTTISRTPVYNLSAVLKETGLQADVLRVWERRYELPKPQRTPGGHRLYSDYDVAIIKWLRARQTEGLSISRAVELWKDISNSGRDPLSEYLATTALEEQPLQVEHLRIDILRNGWLQACLAFDAIKAEDAVNQAFAMVPFETVCFEILQKGISEIGQLWYQGNASVQQEHFATVLAMRRIETLISATPNPTRAQTVLIGCPAGEWHSFSVLLLTLLLRRRGLNVIYLGPNIPLEQMEQTAAAIHPTLIVLATQQLIATAAMQSAAALFQHMGVPLAYGGLIFNRIPELRGQIPAFFLGERLDEAVDRVEQLVASPEPFPAGIGVETTHHETVAIFKSKLPMIEIALMEKLISEGLTNKYMNEVNAYFSAELSAALELGSLSFLEADLEWVKKLLLDRKIPEETLKPYLIAYQQIVSLYMGEPGSVITEWIASYLAKN